MSRPHRIVTMVDSLALGGAERVAVELACALDRSRYAPSVLVTRGSGPLASLLEQAQVPVHVLGRAGRMDVAPWRQARRQLAAGADLLHCHKLGSNAWGSLIAGSLGIPIVAHEHNFGDRVGLGRRLVERLLVARRVERVLCVSESVAAVERSIGIPEPLIEVVPNGVRMDVARPRGEVRRLLGLPEHSFVVGLVGRLSPEKGHDIGLAAVAELAASGRDVHLAIVGGGPLEQELRLRAGALGVASRVTWSGERPDAASLMAAFDAVILPSRWEGLPLVALEAMAAAVPVIASGVGGLPTLLAGDAGEVVPAEDPASLADSIARLMDDPSRRRTLGVHGRERVQASYSFDAMVRRVEDLYDELLARGSSRRPTSSERRAA